MAIDPSSERSTRTPTATARPSANARRHREHAPSTRCSRTSAAATGAERAAHRELVLPPLGPNEKQVHDVRAGDEQHARDGAEHDPQHSTDVADDDVAQRAHDGAHADLLDRLAP